MLQNGIEDPICEPKEPCYIIVHPCLSWRLWTASTCFRVRDDIIDPRHANAQCGPAIILALDSTVSRSGRATPRVSPLTCILDSIGNWVYKLTR